MKILTVLVVWLVTLFAFNLAPGCASAEGRFGPLVTLEVSEAGIALGDFVTWEQRFPDEPVEVYFENHAYWLVYTLWIRAEGAALRRAEFSAWRMENPGGLFVEWATEVGEKRPESLRDLVHAWLGEMGTSQFANMIAARWVTNNPKLEPVQLGIAAFLSRLGVG